MKKGFAYIILVSIFIFGFVYNSIVIGFWNTLGIYLLSCFILYWLIKWIND